MNKLLVFFLILTVNSFSVSIKNGEFIKNGKRFFLSGANIAWYWYGFDFGENKSEQGPLREYKKYIDNVKSNGGNSIRFWLHAEVRIHLISKII